MDRIDTRSLATGANPVAAAYDARTTQLADVQRQKDNDMLKVFEFAGDGMVDEAKYYAQAKGLQIPPQIYENADLAKGVTLGGKFFPNDPVAAEKFSMAWMGTTGDLSTRMAQAKSAVGDFDPNDKAYRRIHDFELWKNSSKPSAPTKPPVDRFKAGADAYNATRSGMATDAQSEAARNSAYKEWDAIYGQQVKPGAGTASPGLTGGGFTPAPAPVAAPQQPQIPSGLPPGTVMIGTTNGRPRYRSPDGREFIDDGNP